MIDSLEGLAESIHEHYLKGDDGKYRLDVTEQDGMALENIAGMRNTIDSVKHEKQQLKDKYKPFDDLEMDISEIQSLKDKVKQMSNWTDDQKLQDKMDAARADAVKEHKAAAETWAQRESKLVGIVKQEQISSKATAAILSAKAEPELMLPIVEKHLQMRETDDGSFITEVINPKTGAARSNNSGDPMSISELVAELKKDPRYGRAFDSTSKGGSDAQNNGGGERKQTDSKKLPDDVDPTYRLQKAHEAEAAKK